MSGAVKGRHIQIGIVCYRNAKTDEFMTARPLYVTSTPEMERQQAFIMTAVENMLAAGLADFINSGNVTKKQGAKNNELSRTRQIDCLPHLHEGRQGETRL
ncbi:hypothetical protein FACS1894211_14250 [Clostridia bacterium]|nr:hypothetical protein FACS1894211_14250 [Clostridia bacterium]